MKLIKCFTFEEDNRSKIELGSKVRLNSTKHWVQLKEEKDADPDNPIDVYPLDDDLYVKTWITQPTSVRGWLGFDANVQHVKVDDVAVTSVNFRLGDGTDEYWWDGGAWVVNTTNWNTESEVANNINNFFWTQKKIQVVSNLKTTNKLFTPKLKEIQILYESNVQFQEDLIFRSLVPMLKSQTRPIGNLQLTLGIDTDSVDLANDYRMQTPYDVVDIDSVFNTTDDQNQENDLFDSFDYASQVITLATIVSAGKNLKINFVYRPKVAVTTSQDYTEINKVPAIVLDDINLLDANEVSIPTFVSNKSNNTAVEIKPPIRGNLEIVARIITDKAIDQARLSDELKRVISSNPLMKSVGLDEDYRLQLLDEYDMRTVANSSDLQTGILRFAIVGALFYIRGSIDKYVIQNLEITVGKT